jgi:hypothetical protein
MELVSHIGRENAMFIAFLIEGLAVYMRGYRPWDGRYCSCCCPAWCFLPGVKFSRCSPPDGRGVCDAENGLMYPDVLCHDRLRHHRRLHGTTLAEASGDARHRQSRGLALTAALAQAANKETEEERHLAEVK